jgi:general secretion pathway protein D
VLSTPNLLTLDNEEAKIVIGQNVPFPTGSYASTSGSVGINPFTTVERKDVGLTLRVRPTINENGTVKMQIFQEISNVAAGTTTDPNGPTTNKRSLESSVLVEDGGLVMLGGLLSDTYGNAIEKVPLAGDIPIVGNLFKNETRKREKNNLMMFLRPVVMRDANSTEAFAYDRYDQIRGLQQATQPNTDNVMLRNVSAAPILPAARAAGRCEQPHRRPARRRHPADSTARAARRQPQAGPEPPARRAAAHGRPRERTRTSLTHAHCPDAPIALILP